MARCTTSSNVASSRRRAVSWRSSCSTSLSKNLASAAAHSNGRRSTREVRATTSVPSTTADHDKLEQALGLYSFERRSHRLKLPLYKLDIRVLLYDSCTQDVSQGCIPTPHNLQVVPGASANWLKKALPVVSLSSIARCQRHQGVRAEPRRRTNCRGIPVVCMSGWCHTCCLLVGCIALADPRARLQKSGRALMRG